MRLLLDEDLDRRLKRFFGEEHEVVTVLERSWGGKGNGELIEATQREFDALITMDQGIPHQASRKPRLQASGFVTVSQAVGWKD